jgi:hypothetical protein
LGPGSNYCLQAQNLGPVTPKYL